MPYPCSLATWSHIGVIRGEITTANPGFMMQGNTYNTVFPPPVGITAITSSPFEIEPVLNSVCPKTLFKTSRGFLEPVSTPQEMYNYVGSVMGVFPI